MKKFLIISLFLVLLFCLDSMFIFSQPISVPVGQDYRLITTGDTISYCLGLFYGSKLREGDIEGFNSKLMSEGISEMANNEKIKIPFDESQKILQSYFAGLQVKIAKRNLDDGKDFLEENKKRPGVITTASGLQYEVLREGTGPSPTDSDNVLIMFTGTLIDGSVFDKSKENQPTVFPVNGVIKGWQEALKLMNVGSKYKFYIPSELGYGEHPDSRSKIQPNSVLIIETLLMKISKSTKMPTPLLNHW
jgi:FKBP-type peptidyl-prolyl cis-trans isomerase FklB